MLCVAFSVWFDVCESYLSLSLQKMARNSSRTLTETILPATNQQQRCTSKLTNTMSSTKLTRRSKRDKRPSSASAATGDGAPNAIPIARRSTMHVYLSGFEHKEKANLTRVSVAWTFLSLR